MRPHKMRDEFVSAVAWWHSADKMNYLHIIASNFNKPHLYACIQDTPIVLYGGGVPLDTDPKVARSNPRVR